MFDGFVFSGTVARLVCSRSGFFTRTVVKKKTEKKNGCGEFWCCVGSILFLSRSSVFQAQKWTLVQQSRAGGVPCTCETVPFLLVWQLHVHSLGLYCWCSAAACLETWRTHRHFNSFRGPPVSLLSYHTTITRRQDVRLMTIRTPTIVAGRGRWGQEYASIRAKKRSDTDTPGRCRAHPDTFIFVLLTALLSSIGSITTVVPHDHTYTNP